MFSATSRFGICLGVILLLHSSHEPRLCAQTTDKNNITLFQKKIQPILESKCYECHSGIAKRLRGGLRLDSREAMLKGGDSGPAIVPGKADDSLLIKALRYQDRDLQMPPKEKLPGAVVADFEKWVGVGAPAPLANVAAGKQKSDHWAFQPIRRPALPAVTKSNWARNPIDLFVLRKLEKEGVAPSPEADRYTLIRRLSLDLLGLPPAPHTVDDFVNDTRPDAYERLVDRLLASPHFGERWARHWLDLARYADSDGYEMDHPRPHAWVWRDWVINAVNSDMPFDQFTIEQIAGDVLPNATWQQKIAAGFHRQTPTNRENGIDKEEFRIKAIIDRVNTTGTVWLGLTVGCAECHSHKYDPITQREYYQLFAFFNNRCDEADLHIPEGVMNASYSRRKDDSLAYTFTFRRKPRRTHLHLRGDFLKKGPEVSPAFPSALHPFTSTSSKKPLDRLALAQWLVDPANPLPARVEVNRIWQHLFGDGLVATPEDFGARGARPTHPQLLDWLATEFVRRSWSRKAMIKLIVASAAYRQSSQHRAELKEIDPENKLLARQNRFRLEAEIIRDQYLAASGLLNRQIGGPSFRPPLPKGIMEIGFKFKWPVDKGSQLHRRGMYIFFQRNLMAPMLQTFDHPDGVVTCTRRQRSNTPLQALTQMNAPIFVEAAQTLAKRVISQSLPSEQTKIDRAFRLCLSRPPSVKEKVILSHLLDKLQVIYENDPQAAQQLTAGQAAIDPQENLAPWIALCRTIMNLDEFITRE